MGEDAASRPATRVERLSAKERACLRLVARRLSSKEIAAELGIAKTSVDTYCDRARVKLGVANRNEAARLVVAALGPGPPAAAMPVGPGRPTSSGRRQLASWLFLTAIGVLALATLLAGLRALDGLAPPPRRPAEKTYNQTGLDSASQQTLRRVAGRLGMTPRTGRTDGG